MWRKLSKEDLIASSPSFTDREIHHPFRWLVYADYELVEQDGQDSYLAAVGGKEGKLAKVYRPLVDTPHLFLEFARVTDDRDPGKALERWLSEHGLLGLSQNEPRRFRGGLPEVEDLQNEGIASINERRIEGEYSKAGGPGESFATVLEEAYIANEVVTLYEAVNSQDGEKMEQAILKGAKNPDVEILREYCRTKAKLAGGANHIEVLTHIATQLVFWRVQETLEKFAYPCIAVDLPLWDVGDNDELYAPELLYRSWQPRNLLGAMYLQAYWVVTSADELSRCRQCSRIISYATPISGRGEARKPRKDKEFCSKQCRQNYHYHTRLKPVREGKKT